MYGDLMQRIENIFDRSKDGIKEIADRREVYRGDYDADDAGSLLMQLAGELEYCARRVGQSAKFSPSIIAEISEISTALEILIRGMKSC